MSIFDIPVMDEVSFEALFAQRWLGSNYVRPMVEIIHDYYEEGDESWVNRRDAARWPGRELDEKDNWRAPAW